LLAFRLCTDSLFKGRQNFDIRETPKAVGYADVSILTDRAFLVGKIFVDGAGIT